MLPRGLEPLMAAALAMLAAAAAFFAGMRLSRARSRWWAVSWAGAFAVILTIAAARRWSELCFVPPFSWVGGGRSQFVAFSGAATFVLATLAPRLPRRRERNWVLLFLGLAVSIFGFGPLLLPAMLRERHEAMRTDVDSNGVCRQHDGYNCGPAAAVTALKWLGLDATIGDIAVRALTTPLTGTPPDLLCAALDERYAADGLRCEYRTFGGLRDIPARGVTIAVIKLSFLIDHYVAVREVAGDEVIVGDPLAGKVTMSRAEFERRWRRTGIVLTRDAR